MIPDSAHGTNPASAAMAGLKVVGIPTNKEGMIPEEAFNEKVNYNALIHVGIENIYLSLAHT